MNLERVLADATGALAERRYTRGKKKAKLGNSQKQALLRAVLHGFGRWCAAQQPAGEAPGLRLTARAIHDLRAQLGFPTLTPEAASDALYEWSLLLRQQQIVDVEDEQGIARVTLRIQHEKDSESYDLTVDVRRDATGAHVYEPVVRAGAQVCDMRMVFQPTDTADSSTLRASRPTPDRERRIARLLEYAPRDSRQQLRDKLSNLGGSEFDRFERDFLQVHRLRPKWALWILLGIIGTPLGAYFAYRYYASLAVPHPWHFLMSQNLTLEPDGTIVLPNAGIKTRAIENKSTGERITVTPTATGGLIISHKESQHALDGVDPRALQQRLGRWVDGYDPGIVLMPIRELVDVLHVQSPQPISPTLFIAYVLPKQDPQLADEIAARKARCTILFSRNPGAGLTKGPVSFDAGTPSERVWGWEAVHEYARAPGRYEIKARITRADGRVEHYTRVLFVEGAGVPRPWAGEHTGLVEVLLGNDARSTPRYALTTYNDCCYAGETLFLDLRAYTHLLERFARSGRVVRRAWIAWKETAIPEELPIQRNSDGTIALPVPPHIFDDAGRKEILVTAEFDPSGADIMTVVVDMKPPRLH